jgi:hypothetical protein
MAAINQRPHIRIRGIYGGVPTQWFEHGETLADYGVNALFLGSGSITAERLALLKQQGAQVFAEFNTMHDAGYLKEHPDAAPIGTDGQVCPPPDGWQGVCPTHPGYRQYRMDTFRAVLKEHAIDGIWLDYHHSHASWEQAHPNMPDTCFCDRCLSRFRQEAAMLLPDRPTAALSTQLLAKHRDKWVQWRCDLFTDWVREFRAIIDEIRPAALLGTFHCPWTDSDFEGALRNKLAIDLKSQAQYIDVFSIMPYHARFGHSTDPAWISRQTAWLGQHLGITGKANERATRAAGTRIWPIVQLSDWGEVVPASQVQEVLDHGTRLPATGVMVFAWGSLHEHKDRVEEMSRFYRAIR